MHIVVPFNSISVKKNSKVRTHIQHVSGKESTVDKLNILVDTVLENLLKPHHTQHQHNVRVDSSEKYTARVKRNKNSY